MRPVFQTVFGAIKGNCMQAAVASMLELPLMAVLDFGNLKGDAYTRMRKYFEDAGYELKRGEPPPDRYYFAIGTSTQGHEHIVIMLNGALAHDPNPKGAGLVRVNGYLWARRVRPMATDAKPKALQGTDIEAKPVYDNEGITAWYREHLVCRARRMLEDALRIIEKHYRPAQDRMALDDDPIVTLRIEMRKWSRRWQKRFDYLSKEMSDSFAGKSQRYTDAMVKKRMREAGFTVRFKPTAQMVSAYRAVAARQVGLIKSIPQQFAKDVEQAVWNAVSKGGAMGALSKELRAKYGVTYRRAALIARDQNNKAKTVMENARRDELGITEATWLHSHAGRHPRPTHLAMHGKRFKIADGMYDSAVKRKVQPGELVGCRCSSRSVIPGRPRRGKS